MRNSAGRRGWALALGVAMLAGGVRSAGAQFDAGIPVGTKAPVITVADLEGTPVDLGRFLGQKVVLIEFWATWCSVCRSLLPELEAVKQTFGDRVELIGINITVNDSRERVRRYIARHAPPFLVLYDDQGVSSRAYDVPTTSFIVVVNREGTVVYTGSGEDQQLVAAVRKAVGP